MTESKLENAKKQKEIAVMCTDASQLIRAHVVELSKGEKDALIHVKTLLKNAPQEKKSAGNVFSKEIKRRPWRQLPFAFTPLLGLLHPVIFFAGLPVCFKILKAAIEDLTACKYKRKPSLYFVDVAVRMMPHLEPTTNNHVLANKRFLLEHARYLTERGQVHQDYSDSLTINHGLTEGERQKLLGQEK